MGREHAARIARLCYVKLMEGVSKEDVKIFRDQQYKLVEEFQSAEVSADTSAMPPAREDDLTRVETETKNQSLTSKLATNAINFRSPQRDGEGAKLTEGLSTEGVEICCDQQHKP